MELRVIQYFLAVAREENITRAAESLHITQPTLSRQLHQLEAELGVTLFERSNHRVFLTEDGMLFRRRAQEIVDLVQKTREEFFNAEGKFAGTITIGAGETYNMEILASWMHDFRLQHPLVNFKVQSNTADIIKENIEKGIVDIGLLMEPVDTSRYEVLRMPQKEAWGVVVTADDELATKKEIVPHDLAGRSVIVPAREEVQMNLKKWFSTIYDDIDVTATYNLSFNAILMVKQHVGVLITLDFRLLDDNLRFIPLKDMQLVESVIVWKKQCLLSPLVQCFIKWCRMQNLASSAGR